MATRLSLPREQVFSDTGTPLPGAKLYFYAAGTSTLKTTYSDAALTTANANPVVADSGGRFGDVFLDTGDYRVILQTSAGVTVWSADPVAGASSGGSLLDGAQNLLINGDFRVNQRASTTVADDFYCLDRWYVLTQTGPVTVAQSFTLNGGQYRNILLTQPSVTAQRFGLAQIVEVTETVPLHGSAVAFSGRLRCSVAQTIRYAILEWTGVADAVTSDVVLDWTSTSYVPGGFFLSSNLRVTATGSFTPAANVWTDIPVATGVVSGGAQNMIVLVWTSGTLAQNANLDLGLMRLVVGTTAATFPARPIQQETALCQRFYEAGTNYMAGYSVSGVSACSSTVAFKVTKWAAPTVTATLFGAINCTAVPIGAVTTGSVELTRTITATGSFAGNATWTASAEL